MGPYTGLYYQVENGCECCSPRSSTYTTSASQPHKWTKAEIEAGMLNYIRKWRKAGFWQRGHLLNELRHWTAKYERFLEAEQDFELSEKKP